MSKLALRVLVARFNSNSFTSMYNFLPPAAPSSSVPSYFCKHVSLIFLTRGSLREGLNPNIKLMILCLNGWPLGSILLSLHTSIINFSEFYLTFVFLWVHH